MKFSQEHANWFIVVPVVRKRVINEVPHHGLRMCLWYSGQAGRKLRNNISKTQGTNWKNGKPMYVFEPILYIKIYIGRYINTFNVPCRSPFFEIWS